MIVILHSVLTKKRKRENVDPYCKIIIITPASSKSQ